MSELDFLLGKKDNQPTKEETRTNDNVSENVNEKPDYTENKIEQNINDKLKKDNIESVMLKFLNRDPKIGIWSYPSFILLQYLYNTVPGFKMSKVAKEALEMGLREMYPELFKKAEELYHSRMLKE
ncbi:hypothetical protein [Sulfuracidifex metallicus]|uniref:hypothetical protein n=1 Tax=Sulfuracidifex metallicus TaxID=47303 RepID=UPI002273537D|nr:hypothetical protein [Sulfuracidifex metallicus]MCY0850322.1 hypothetical protein [Sulfuracidifex metallicus]